MCSARVSALNVDSPRTTCPIASLTTSSKRDMWAPFWSGPRSTTHSNRAEKSCSRSPWLRRMTFSTPVTPTRERPSWTGGAWACTSRIETVGVRGGFIATHRVDGGECGLGSSGTLDNAVDCAITPPVPLTGDTERVVVYRAGGRDEGRSSGAVSDDVVLLGDETPIAELE